MDTAFRKIFAISALLCILVGFTSLYGFSFPEKIYVHETASWKIQSTAQDFVNLVIVLPVLASMVVLMKKNREGSYSIAAGILAYLAYTYIIYCFDIHFNALFILYCAILGLCIFSLLVLFKATVPEKKIHVAHQGLNRTIGIYLISLSVLFFFLWTREIISAQLNGTSPVSLDKTGLPTNPVHVLDLSIVLPVGFITGINLLRRKENGRLPIPALLTFFALMQATVGTLNLLMAHNGINVKAAITAFMYGMSVFSLLLLMIYFKINTRKSTQL
jgi:hypothetical protein